MSKRDFCDANLHLSCDGMVSGSLLTPSKYIFELGDIMQTLRLAFFISLLGKVVRWVEGDVGLCERKLVGDDSKSIKGIISNPKLVFKIIELKSRLNSRKLHMGEVAASLSNPKITNYIEPCGLSQYCYAAGIFSALI